MCLQLWVGKRNFLTSALSGRKSFFGERENRGRGTICFLAENWGSDLNVGKGRKQLLPYPLKGGIKHRESHGKRVWKDVT